YRMLETVRAYAADRLHEAGEGAATRKRLAEHYLERFPWPSLRGFAVEADTLAPLVDGLLDDGQSDEALALARMLSLFRHAEGRVTLALDDLELAIERAEPSSAMLVRAEVGAVLIAARLGQVERAERHLRRAHQLVAERGAQDRWGRVSLARCEA